jgi:hypothetical protein
VPAACSLHVDMPRVFTAQQIKLLTIKWLLYVLAGIHVNKASTRVDGPSYACMAFNFAPLIFGQSSNIAGDPAVNWTSSRQLTTRPLT